MKRLLTLPGLLLQRPLSQREEQPQGDRAREASAERVEEKETGGGGATAWGVSAASHSTVTWKILRASQN